LQSVKKPASLRGGVFSSKRLRTLRGSAERHTAEVHRPCTIRSWGEFGRRTRKQLNSEEQRRWPKLPTRSRRLMQHRLHSKPPPTHRTRKRHPASPSNVCTLRPASRPMTRSNGNCAPPTSPTPRAT